MYYGPYYFLKNSFRYRKRNFVKFIGRDFAVLFYCSFILIVSQLTLWIHLIKNKETAVNIDPVAGGSVSTEPQLIFILTVLEKSFSLIAYSSLLFGMVYLFISLQREFIIGKPEFLIKGLNGSSSLAIVSEFFAEQFLVWPFIFVASILLSRQLLLKIVLLIGKMGWNEGDFLISSAFLRPSFILMGSGLLFATLTFFFFLFKKKIRNLL